MMSAWVSSRVQTTSVCGRLAREHRVEVGASRPAPSTPSVAATTASRSGLVSLRPTSATSLGAGLRHVPAPGAGAAVAGADDGEPPLVGLHGKSHCHGSNSTVTMCRPRRCQGDGIGPEAADMKASAEAITELRRGATSARPGADEARHPGRRPRGVRRVRAGRRARRPDRRAGRRQQAHALPLRRQQGGALLPRPARRLPRHPRRRGRAAPRRARPGRGDGEAGRLHLRPLPARTPGSSGCSPPRTSSAAPSCARCRTSPGCTRRSSPRSADVLAAGEAGGVFRPRRRPGAALHHHRRHQLFLHVEHPHAVGDLRRAAGGGSQHGRAAGARDRGRARIPAAGEIRLRGK